MIDMMVSTGSLYEQHPMYILMDEIINECIKIKKLKNKKI